MKNGFPGGGDGFIEAVQSVMRGSSIAYEELRPTTSGHSLGGDGWADTQQLIDRDELKKAIASSSPKLRKGYSRTHFLTAYALLEYNPKELTFDDCENLAIVDPALGARARSVLERGGAPPPLTDSEVAQYKFPVSLRMLGTWYRRTLHPTIATLLYSVRQHQAKYQELEERLQRIEQHQHEDRGDSVGKADIAYLAERIHALESRKAVTYHGVWGPDAQYTAGMAVTADGSMWVALQPVKGVKPPNSQYWQLAVKRGRDGRDGSDGRDAEERFR